MIRKKKTDRAKLVEKLDKVFSLYIRQRDKKCVQCGATDNLTCGHLFSRVAYSTRWDEENCYAQCLKDNMRHEYDAYNFTEVVRGKIGTGRLEALHLRYTRPQKFKDWELQALIDHYNRITTRPESQ